MKDPRMTAVQNRQPGFKKLKAGAMRKSERRSTMRSHHRRSRSKY
jgi:hypothetical protein